MNFSNCAHTSSSDKDKNKNLFGVPEKSKDNVKSPVKKGNLFGDTELKMNVGIRDDNIIFG